MPGPAAPTLNHFLAALPAATVRTLVESGHDGPAREGVRLFAIGQPVEEFVFPLSGMVSLTVDTSEGQSVEVAVTGCEGFVGVGRYLGKATADSNAVVQVAGDMFHIPAQVVIDAADGAFRRAADRLVSSLMVEMAQSAACNQVHSVEQRTARWLLHAADRAGMTDLRLTHEFLSQMLSVRRASVTTVVGIFTRAKLTVGQRGRISIADREGLRGLACECYEIVRAATPTYD